MRDLTRQLGKAAERWPAMQSAVCACPTCGGEATPQQWLSRWRGAATRAQYRPAQVALRAAPHIPAQLFQLSHTPERELASNGGLMRGWWEQNPGYDYHLLSECDCWQFVSAFSSSLQARAYMATKTGAQRADLCRVHLLLHLGGVYADADLELEQPLHLWLPPNATAVKMPFRADQKGHWAFTFLAFCKDHPIVRQHVASASSAVVMQQARLRSGDAACFDVATCVFNTTGPAAFRRAWQSVASRCPQLVAGIAGWPCLFSGSDELRATYASARVLIRHHACGLLGNLSTRPPTQSRACAPDHYKRRREDAGKYFDIHRAMDWKVRAQ